MESDCGFLVTRLAVSSCFTPATVLGVEVLEASAQGEPGVHVMGGEPFDTYCERWLHLGASGERPNHHGRWGMCRQRPVLGAGWDKVT